MQNGTLKVQYYTVLNNLRTEHLEGKTTDKLRTDGAMIPIPVCNYPLDRSKEFCPQHTVCLSTGQWWGKLLLT